MTDFSNNNYIILNGIKMEINDSQYQEIIKILNKEIKNKNTTETSFKNKHLDGFFCELKPPFKIYDNRTNQAKTKIIFAYHVVVFLLKTGFYSPKNGRISISKIRAICDGDLHTVKRFFENKENLKLYPLEISKINLKN